MKIIKMLFFVGCFFISWQIHCQSNPLKINPNIILPQDAAEKENLISSLNNFLTAAQKPNEENQYVFVKEKAETFVLLDEIRGIGKSGKFQDENFYKPYLTNVVPIENNSYLIQLSYIGNYENEAILRASFELIAHQSDKQFTYSSPLLRNTAKWKTKKIDNTVFHYQNMINTNKAKEFSRLASLYDSKLRSKGKTTEIYCSRDIIELQKLVGVDYKSDYNGRKKSVWSSSYNGKQILVLGNANSSFDNFDSHDLWHDRLSLVIDRSKVNNAVDEGCAYWYGGSWGLGWKEIFNAFKEQIANNKNTDWVAIKEKDVRFTTGNFTNSSDNIVNALLVKKIEKEKGVAGVWELLNSGPAEPGNAKYYQVLEKLTGITKADYNKKIWELIADN